MALTSSKNPRTLENDWLPALVGGSALRGFPISPIAFGEIAANREASRPAWPYYGHLFRTPGQQKAMTRENRSPFALPAGAQE
jgi:hypothetical protein